MKNPNSNNSIISPSTKSNNKEGISPKQPQKPDPKAKPNPLIAPFRKLYEQYGETRQATAKALGVSPNYLTSILTGKRIVTQKVNLAMKNLVENKRLSQEKYLLFKFPDDIQERLDKLPPEARQKAIQKYEQKLEKMAIEAMDRIVEGAEIFLAD